jgi:alkane 1-monooxygenase
MKWRILKYLMAYSIPALVFLSFQLQGFGAYIPMLYAFALVPGLELIFKPNAKNVNQQIEEQIFQDPWYDRLLFLMVPIQYFLLFYFLLNLNEDLSSFTYWGRISAMGLMCGVVGINVGHELGHRRSKLEQNLAKLLLSSSLYVHFFIEHNFGHHRNVATPEDPATARYNESLYFFWLRSIVQSYLHAWHIQKQQLKSKKQRFWSRSNDLLKWHFFQLVMLVAVFSLFGSFVFFAFLAAAFFGMLLLETVNYIEHYGLNRKKVTAYRYENTQAQHSWNSNHLIGRMLLFELSRHSDHHAFPHRKYQILQHHDESPQLPSGYPGMMLLSACPPIWFWLMNNRLPD